MPATVTTLPRRPRSVGVEVAAHLERLIAAGDFAPGDRIPPERELAVMLGVSRTSVREALLELQGKHLLERAPGRGTTVATVPPTVAAMVEELQPRTLAEVSELREVIEPRIAELAAVRRSEADLVLLEESLAAANETLGVAESVRLDVSFHTLLAQAARNQLLAALCTLATTWTGDVRRLSHRTRGARRSSIQGHQQIMAAVVARDPAAARDAMRAHLREVAELTLQRGGVSR